MPCKAKTQYMLALQVGLEAETAFWLCTAELFNYGKDGRPTHHVQVTRDDTKMLI